MTIPEWLGDNPTPREIKYVTTPAAVYRLWDADGNLLYIGSAYDPDLRCKGHHTKSWWPEVARRTEEWYPARGSAFKAEMAAISAEGSKYNVMGTPTYVTPSTPAIRRRNELAGERQRLLRESDRIGAEVSKEQRAEGVSYDDARRAGRLAAIGFLEDTGLFVDAVKRYRKRLETHGW